MTSCFLLITLALSPEESETITVRLETVFLKATEIAKMFPMLFKSVLKLLHMKKRTQLLPRSL